MPCYRGHCCWPNCLILYSMVPTTYTQECTIYSPPSNCWCALLSLPFLGSVEWDPSVRTRVLGCEQWANLMGFGERGEKCLLEGRASFSYVVVVLKVCSRNNTHYCMLYAWYKKTRLSILEEFKAESLRKWEVLEYSNYHARLLVFRLCYTVECIAWYGWLGIWRRRRRILKDLSPVCVLLFVVAHSSRLPLPPCQLVMLRRRRRRWCWCFLPSQTYPQQSFSFACDNKKTRERRGL